MGTLLLVTGVAAGKALADVAALALREDFVSLSWLETQVRAQGDASHGGWELLQS